MGGAMQALVDKLSSYNIFNYLLPGAVFSVLAERLSLIESPEQIVEKLAWYYFIGMVISRFGSVIIEPVLKWLKFVTYSEYSSYLAACESDKKLEILVEVSNTYRTVASAFLALLLCIVTVPLSKWIGIDSMLQGKIAVAFLLALFLLSFRKQVAFITSRVTFRTGEMK
jgi:hypothetical protein